VLRIAGVVFALVGLGAGLFLLAGSFGLTPNAPGLSAWILFPACAFGGLVLAALGSRTGALPGLLKVAGGALLLLAVAAAVGLLLSAAGYAERGTERLALVPARRRGPRGRRVAPRPGASGREGLRRRGRRRSAARPSRDSPGAPGRRPQPTCRSAAVIFVKAARPAGKRPPKKPITREKTIPVRRS
jgi:hypothetical protein